MPGCICTGPRNRIEFINVVCGLIKLTSNHVNEATLHDTIGPVPTMREPDHISMSCVDFDRSHVAVKRPQRRFSIRSLTHQNIRMEAQDKGMRVQTKLVPMIGLVS
jgi:hypothetical protein